MVEWRTFQLEQAFEETCNTLKLESEIVKKLWIINLMINHENLFKHAAIQIESNFQFNQKTTFQVTRLS